MIIAIANLDKTSLKYFSPIVFISESVETMRWFDELTGTAGRSGLDSEQVAAGAVQRRSAGIQTCDIAAPQPFLLHPSPFFRIPAASQRSQLLLNDP